MPLWTLRRWAARVGLVPALCLPWFSSLAASGLPSIAEEITGVQFEGTATVDGTAYRCLGAGARRVFIFKVYAVGFCLEEKSAQEVLGHWAGAEPALSPQELAKSLENDQRFFDALGAAPGRKMIVMQFMRDVGRERIASALGNTMRGYAPAEEVDRLVAAVPAGVKSGERLVIYSRGRDLALEARGTTRVVSDTPVAAERLWQVWLGPYSMTPNIKASIAQRVSQARD